jgi:peptide deformylase
MVRIYQLTDSDGPKVLRTKAAAIAIEDIQNSETKATIKDLTEALHSQSDGIAIAAPQIGVSKRIFIVSGEMLKKSTESDEEKSTTGKKALNPFHSLPDLLVCINPVITRRSKETQEIEEGCLSIRNVYGHVRRAKRVTLKAYNEKGELFERGASGLLAQTFQHELDHLDGILFIDKARDIFEVVPENGTVI